MDKVRVIVSFKFNHQITDGTHARLLAFAKAAKSNPGCEQFELLEDLEQPEFFSFVELWSSSEAVDLYTATPYFRDFVTFLAGNVTSLNVKRMKRLAI